MKENGNGMNKRKKPYEPATVETIVYPINEIMIVSGDGGFMGEDDFFNE